jgi:hypothetical protein
MSLEGAPIPPCCAQTPPSTGRVWPSDVAGLVGEQPHDGIVDLVRPVDPSHRDKRHVAVTVSD